MSLRGVAGPPGLRRIVAPVFAVAAILLVAPAACAVPLPPIGNPLPGSSFEGADGNQTAVAPRTDWATLGVGTVAHSPDLNAQDTAFAGGSKENEPGNWDLVTEPGGVNPAKDNILDAWSSVDEVGANTFLYLAFAREAGNGGSFIAFELNRDRQRWDNGNARIPCRRDGDLLIGFELNGNNVTASVETWRTSATDPMTGCARTGSWIDDASVTANDIQGAVNASDIANSLPGISGATIPAYQFGETAINLGRVLSSARGTTCGAFTSFWMHSRSSESESSNMQDFVAPHTIDARRCSAGGTKWLDNNANGVRDPGDTPLAGFRIYADLNDNSSYDSGEPFAITDENGDYIIDDIKASGTYTLREEPTRAVPLAGPWNCSHPSPCTWTVDAAAVPYAKDRDFGNWRPARLTLQKQISPADDPGRFDLTAGTPETTVLNAGNGDGKTFQVRPGTYIVTETAAAGTNAADYDSNVVCDLVTRRGRLGGTTTSTGPIAGGQHVHCIFVNVRHGKPSVTLDKVLVEPLLPMHGDTLRYQLAVFNGGSVAFDAGDVKVTDPECNDEPALIRQISADGITPDTTPGSLDPKETWIYQCHVKTEQVDPAGCEPKTITNTGHVTVPGAGSSDETDDVLRCPVPLRPGVAIQKFGPATAEAGTPLTYVFYVTNTGQVPFAQENVTVSDPACDAPPQLVARFQASGNPDTSSPTVFDPGDVWIYICTNATPPPGPDCQPSVVTNTATVIATSSRPTVQDSDDFHTPLTCPPPGPGPLPLPAPQPQPETPAPTPQQTTNLVPPTAGVAGTSALSPIRGCVRRGTRVVIRGSRIASITVTARGRRVGGLRVTPLQRRAIIRVVGNLIPGVYRTTATIRFQRGAATPTVRLTRRVRVCAVAAQVPSFTG